MFIIILYNIINKVFCIKLSPIKLTFTYKYNFKILVITLLSNLHLINLTIYNINSKNEITYDANHSNNLTRYSENK